MCVTVFSLSVARKVKTQSFTCKSIFQYLTFLGAFTVMRSGIKIVRYVCLSVCPVCQSVRTDSTQQSFWEADSPSTSPKIPRLLWNPNVHYRVHRISRPIPILSQMNSIHFLLVCPYAWNNSRTDEPISTKFDIGKFYEKLSRHFSFHKDRTVLTTMLHRE
jgi:hypothetical protein